MPPPIKTTSSNKTEYKTAGELRRSQIITTFGMGAIVDLPRFSGIMAGIDSWNISRLSEEAKIREKNLEKMLGKKYFIQASSPETESGNTFGLRAFRFPTWYYCPICHHLDFYSKIARSVSFNKTEFNSSLCCNNPDHKEQIKLIPSRFIVACRNGHIEDFPYIWWVHKGQGSVCSSPKLDLYYEGTSGGLGSIRIICKCGAQNTMLGCMNENSLKGLKCSGNSPWLGLSDERGWYKDPHDCTAQLRVLQRSANNVYYPVNQSALTIPPWSAKIQAILTAKIGKFEHIFEEDDKEELDRQLKKDYQKHSKEYGCDEKTFVREAYKRYGKEQSNEIVNKISLRCEEYRAFCGEDKNEEYFKAETTAVPDGFSDYFSKIKMVKKLREVMVLQGFKRIDPLVISDSSRRKELGLSNDFSPISKQPLDWLPAIELFGEGIFLQFKEDAVKKWELSNTEYYEKMGGKLLPDWEWGQMFNSKEPRFILLHTFAHLLIRQLTAQCGYATASIKERIYSTFSGSDEKMAGILIYTSATDTDGSLGGLARQGESGRINATIKSLLEESSWCSNDPICIESKNQGFRGLNYASCHACTLLPETSCEHFNCLLDRASVTGLPDRTNEIAFFKDLSIR